MNLKHDKIIINDDLMQITPEIIAELFCELDSEKQARFFNHVADTASIWDGGGLVMQMQYITDEDGLNDSGRRVMSYIGDYSHWGVVK